MGSLFDPGGLYALLNPIVLSYALIMSRLIGLFLSSPLFSNPQIPSQLKSLTVMVLGMLLLGPVGIRPDLVELQLLQYVGLVAAEVAIGVFIGLILTLVFSGIEFAGRLFGIQMGFAVANVVDPTTSQQIGVLSQIIRFIFIFVFFSMDGHLMLVKCLAVSFQVLPLGVGEFNASLIADDIIAVGANLFVIAMKIALPISCAVLLINTGFAALARTTPQLNIFMVAFMVNILAGLFILSFALPSLVALFTRIIHNSFELIGELVNKLAG
jgi:flagellar biosynthesis protein FliR